MERYVSCPTALCFGQRLAIRSCRIAGEKPGLLVPETSLFPSILVVRPSRNANRIETEAFKQIY